MDGIDGALPDPLGCRWRASLSHKENPRGGLDFYRDQFDQQKDEQVQRVAAIHARSKSSLEEELTVDTARQTLQDIVDMCAGALQLNAPLGSLSNGSVSQAPSSGPFLMSSQPTRTMMSQKPLSSDMVCLPLNEMGIDDGLLAEPSEGITPVQDIGCEQSLPSVSQKPLFWPTGGKLTFSWICDVMLGFDWSSRNLPACEFSNVLPFNVLDELILSASKILRKEPNCVRIDSDKAKVVVVGDLHGQLHDLLFLMQDAGFPNGDQFYVFNGNYVDNGAWGLETFLLLLSWKVFLPDRVFVLRGSHESESCTSLYGFKNEVLTKYGDKGAIVYKKCLECFQLLPLASVIGGKVFTAHGGLFRDVSSFLSDKQERSRKRKRAQKNQEDNSVLETDSRSESLLLGSLKDLFKVKRRVINPSAEGSNLIPGDILWSDPSTDNGLFLNKESGIGLLWGPDCTAKFLQDNDLKLIIRGKEAPHKRAQRDGLPSMIEGFSKDHEGLITLFSAPDNPQFQDTEERHNNKGAYIILQIPYCEEPEIHVFEAVSPRPKAEAYYDYRGLIQSTGTLVHNNTNSVAVDSPFSAPDDKDSLISSENVEDKSMDLSEAMEVDEKDDEVTTFGTLASDDKDMVDSSEQTKDFSKEHDRSETAEISTDLLDAAGKPESRPPKVIDMEPPLACDLHVLDSGKYIESWTEKAADELMAVDEIAGVSESTTGEENDVEASNSTKISEERAEKERTSDSLEFSNNVSEEEAPRVNDCSTTGDAAVELEITYDEKPESAVTGVTGNDIATDGAEKTPLPARKLSYSEPLEDMVDFNMEDIATDGANNDPGTVNGGLNTDCTSLSKCLTSKSSGSEPAVDHDNLTKPSRDKDHEEPADKPERVVKLVTYSKRKSSDKKQVVDSSEDPQQKINEAVDYKTKTALDKSHSVPRDMDS
ncbi:hypothetical protein DY000_02058815 [Brassica cretica]|uniref:Serine/threonine specific protein phosphatases domain-containing protein n=1 Tax=Brassica cretica TaxID=69181 RepID=A0ABQ7AWC2_BRACR|nr:hypothetical protein DY000_02058815 [Brassica cretica]